MNTLLTMLLFSACQILVGVCFLVLVRWWIHRTEQRIRSEISEAVRIFITAPDDKTPSPLALLIDQGALVLASRLMQQVKAMLAGAESGRSKAEAEQMQEQIMGHAPPWASLVLGILPAKLRNQLLRNPQMIGALAKMTGGNNAGDSEVTEIQRRMTLQ